MRSLVPWGRRLEMEKATSNFSGYLTYTGLLHILLVGSSKKNKTIKRI